MCMYIYTYNVCTIYVRTYVCMYLCVYAGLSGNDAVGKELGYCLQLVFGCLIQWSDQSKLFRATMIKEGLIFENIQMLIKLGSAIGNQVYTNHVCM